MSVAVVLSFWALIHFFEGCTHPVPKGGLHLHQEQKASLCV